MAIKINLVGQTKPKFQRRNMRLQQSCIREFNKDSNNIHGYRSEHKLKVHRIPTNTPQKELHQIDLQETIVLIIKREKEEAI